MDAMSRFIIAVLVVVGVAVVVFFASRKSSDALEVGGIYSTGLRAALKAAGVETEDDACPR